MRQSAARGAVAALSSEAVSGLGRAPPEDGSSFSVLTRRRGAGMLTVAFVVFAGTAAAAAAAALCYVHGGRKQNVSTRGPHGCKWGKWDSVACERGVGGPIGCGEAGKIMTRGAYRWRGNVQPQVLHLGERRPGSERVPHALYGDEKDRNEFSASKTPASMTGYLKRGLRSRVSFCERFVEDGGDIAEAYFVFVVILRLRALLRGQNVDDDCVSRHRPRRVLHRILKTSP